MTISNFSVSDWGISYTYSSYLSFSEIDLNKLAVRLITNDLAELIIESNQIVYWKFNDELRVAQLLFTPDEDGNSGAFHLELLFGSTLEMTEDIEVFFEDACNLAFSDQKLFNTTDVKKNIRVYCQKFLAKYSYGEFLILPCLKIFEDGVTLVKYKLESKNKDIKIYDFIENFVNIGLNKFLDIKVSPSISKLSSISYMYSIKQSIFSRFKCLKDAKMHINEVNNRTSEYTIENQIFRLVEFPGAENNKDSFSSLTLTYLNIINFIYVAPKRDWHFLLFGINGRVHQSNYWSGRPYVYLFDFKDKEQTASQNNNKFYKEFIGIIQRAYNPYITIQELPEDMRAFEDSSDFISSSGYLCAFSNILNEDGVKNAIYNKEIISEYLEYGYIIHKALKAKIQYSNNLSETFLLRSYVNNLGELYELSYSGEVRTFLEKGWQEFGLSKIKKQIDEEINIDHDYKNYKYQIYNNNFNRFLTIIFGVLTIPTIAKEVIVPIWRYSEIMVPKDENLITIFSLIIAFFTITTLVYLLRILLKFNKK